MLSREKKAVFDSRSNAFIFNNEVRFKLAPGAIPDLANLNSIVYQVNGQIVGCIPALSEYLLEFTGDAKGSSGFGSKQTPERGQ